MMAAMERAPPAKKGRPLVCFDMEGTLLDGETLDTLAARAGVEGEVRRITELAMGGRMDFRQAVEARLSLLRGMPVAEVVDVADSLPLMPGAEELIARLKERGVMTGMVTGGFSLVADRVAERLGLDFCVSNEIHEKDGALTGGFELAVSGNKGEIMREQARRLGAGRVFAVGDGANDIGMIRAADVGIAFCAKPVLEKEAAHCVKEKDMMRILKILEDEMHARY
jgi:phosphoserine phosphatase